jgi:hypothetical protein
VDESVTVANEVEPPITEGADRMTDETTGVERIVNVAFCASPVVEAVIAAVVSPDKCRRASRSASRKSSFRPLRARLDD